MEDRLQTKRFGPGEILIREGADSNFVYLIKSGRVEIRKTRAGRPPQILETVGRGEIIGEMSLFDDSPPMASAVAVEPTHVSAISREDFKDRIKDMSPLMRGIVRVLVGRLRNVSHEDIRRSELHWSDLKEK